MNVIGHQAIGPDLDRCPTAALGEDVAIERVIVWFEEDALAAIAALGHMMRKPGNDHAR